MIELATRAGRVKVENSTAPTPPPLPEADASDIDCFVSQLEIVLPVLSVNAIRVPLPKPTTTAQQGDSQSPVFQLRNTKAGVDARAQQIDGEFTMLEGSIILASWHGVGKAAPAQSGRTRRFALSMSN